MRHDLYDPHVHDIPTILRRLKAQDRDIRRKVGQALRAANRERWMENAERLAGVRAERG